MGLAELDFSSGKVWTIAEIGNNHNGSYVAAEKLIEEAAAAGADSIKFQLRSSDELYRDVPPEKEDLGVQYVKDLLKKYSLTDDEHLALKAVVESFGCEYLCTPWDEKSLIKLRQWGLDTVKIASADFLNFGLVERALDLGFDAIIVSTGMASEDEIVEFASYFQESLERIKVLHCVSAYPAALEDLNLAYIEKLKQLFHCVGYSGHERGIGASIFAAAHGARIIERHITLDKTLEGPDHAASLTPDEFSMLVQLIKEGISAVGLPQKTLSQGQLINRENLGKSLCYRAAFPKGHVIKARDIVVRSPGRGISPNRFSEFVGKELFKEVEDGEFLSISDFGNRERKWVKRFCQPHGVPVRYHDFAEFEKIFPSVDLFEFHLSYQDVYELPENYIEQIQSTELVVHAPEMFEKSHVVDLMSTDRRYREQSIKHLEDTISCALALKEYFPNTARVPLILNCGGFSVSGFDDDFLMNKSMRYQLLAEALDILDREEVLLLPQTMAPYPWLFGGVYFQNSFQTPKEIVKFANEYGRKFCLDISHTYLSSQHHHFDFLDAIEEILPVTGHIHIGDGKGVRGEGLPIGEGDIDWPSLVKILNEYQVSFIPEIWQGHRDKGKGFIDAFERLEKYGLQMR